MLCPKCGKESNNLRVCAFCQTPYPTEQSGRSSMATPRYTGAIPATAAGDPRVGIAKRSRAKRWGVIGFLAAFTAGFYFFTRDPVIPVGVALPNLIAGPMSPLAAKGIVARVNAVSQIETRDGELVVHVGATIFPERRDGQLAFAQQYARADEIVEGKKRAIGFLDPLGNRFAKADPDKGVVMVR